MLKYLNSDNRRILVADEVGLGKTIEAGHILLEMKARGQLRNALIICPKSLQVKWREELLNKFGLPFKIYDDLKEYVQDLKDRGSNLKAILNYEKVRSNKEKLADGKTEIQKNPLLSYLQETDRFIDFVICDEAHRTTGATALGSAESAFVRIHDNSYIKADKRLYMTATPRLYGDSAKKKAEEKDIILCSMDDEELYGKEIYRIGFGRAVELGALSDYKVLVLTLRDDTPLPSDVMGAIQDENQEINTDDAVKLVGCGLLLCFGISTVRNNPLAKSKDSKRCRSYQDLCE